MCGIFNGSSSHIVGSWMPGNIRPYWVQAWFKQESAAHGCALWFGNSGRQDQYRQLVTLGSGDQTIEFRSRHTGGSVPIESGNTINYSEWNHALFEETASHDKRVILNGDVVSGGFIDTSVTWQTVITLAIGRINTNSPGTYFSGRIGYVWIGEGELSNAQRTALASGYHYSLFKGLGLDALDVIIDQPLVAAANEGSDGVSLTANNMTWDSDDNPPIVFELDKRFRALRSPLLSPSYPSLRPTTSL
ncbi:MAG: hypothetical protein WDZ59_12585 [Pirellulales bacterium]